MIKKNIHAVALGALSPKMITKEQLKNRVMKAASKSHELRKKYGYGYWNDKELYKKIIKEGQDLL
jgi:aromatic ring-opening dioxygenase LigB subunit